MDFKLILPSKKYKEKIMAFKKIMLDNESAMDGCGSLRRNDFASWMKMGRLNKKGEYLPEGFTKQVQYIFVRKGDDKIVGMLQARVGDNEVFGNMGFCISADERCKGYGKEILRLGLLKAKRLGLDKVVLTCLEDNFASKKCIVANGGVFVKKLYSEVKNANLEQFIIGIQ